MPPIPHSEPSPQQPARPSCSAPPARPVTVAPDADPSQLIPRGRIFLDLFAGASSPVSAAVAALGKDRCEPIDLLSGPHVDVLQDDQFHALARLCSSGLIGAAVAGPPCSAFSRARLRPGGPKPVRTVAHPEGIPDPDPRQADELTKSALLHERARALLQLVASRGGLVVLENPTSSFTWSSAAMTSWVRNTAPTLVQVAGCAHGMNAAKSWLLACNFDSAANLQSVCSHPPGFHPAVSGKRLPDGTFATRLTARYPDSMAQAIASAVAPALTSRLGLVDYHTWTSLLPSAPPRPPHGEVL